MSRRISITYAWAGVTSTPPRASRAAGLTKSASGTRPKRADASHTPAGIPYVPTDAAPMLNTWIASPNETVIGISSSRASESAPRPGASTKKSSSTGARSGATTSMYPPAPNPVSSDSHTNDASIAPTAASTALPPSRSTSAPA